MWMTQMMPQQIMNHKKKFLNKKIPTRKLLVKNPTPTGKRHALKIYDTFMPSIKSEKSKY